MAQRYATISGQQAGMLLDCIEVPEDLYDRFRAMKALWKFSADDMVGLATDGGRLPLDTESIRALVERMEETAEEMGELRKTK